MKFFLLCLSVLLVVTLCPLSVHAEKTAAPVQKQVEQVKEEVTSNRAAEKISARKKQSAATTFTPTEKIGADTVIAFPVDI